VCRRYLLGNQQYGCAVFSNGSVFLSDQQYEYSVFSIGSVPVLCEGQTYGTVTSLFLFLV
jgi:hypothetical protein